MKYTRQNKIIELIGQYDIQTQGELAGILNENGFKVTQATVSRDIKNLMLTKEIRNGKSCYAMPRSADNSSGDKLNKIMKDTILSVDSSENMIVVKTLNGCSGPAAEAIDMNSGDDILGTIAGENTVFVVARSRENVPKIIEAIKKVIES
ncbi:MAG: arginine repressor [Firmicutes bacterium]|nr:arginine repressor [Bacillota bacterium]